MHDGALRGVAAGGCVVGALLLGAAALGGGSASPRPPSSSQADLPRQRWFAPSSTGVFYTFDGQLRWTDATYPGVGLPVGK